MPIVTTMKKHLIHYAVNDGELFDPDRFRSHMPDVMIVDLKSCNIDKIAHMIGFFSNTDDLLCFIEDHIKQYCPTKIYSIEISDENYEMMLEASDDYDFYKLIISRLSLETSNKIEEIFNKLKISI